MNKFKFKYSFNTAINLFLDTFFIFLVLGLSVIIRKIIIPKIFISVPDFKLNFEFIIFTTLFWILFLSFEGLYTKRLFFWDEVKILWKSSIFVPAVILILVSLTKSNEYISRSVILISSFLSIILFPLYKSVIKIVLRRLDLYRVRIAIIGSKKVVFDAYKTIISDINGNYEIVSFFVTDIKKRRKIGNVNLIPFKMFSTKYINLLNVDEIYLCMYGVKLESIQRFIDNFQLKTKNLFIIPDIKNLPLISSEFHLIFQKQMFVLELKNNLLKLSHRIIKDILERLIAIILIIIFFLPMVIIYILIVTTSEGPGIFVQDRLGKNGKIFKIYKFRTMYINSDEILEKYFLINPDAKMEFEKYWKLKNDPRVTKIGKFLRKTSLDELPQLFNVLKGDMSLIGPRPYLPEEIKFLGKNSEVILSVKPGITGLWQVSGRSNKDYNCRIALDIWYIRNWSLWIDIVIFIKTILTVIKREGAY